MESYAVIARRSLFAAALFFLGFIWHAAQGAATDARRKFDLPAGPAEKSLRLFSEQSGSGIVFSTDKVQDVRTNAVRGEFSSPRRTRSTAWGTRSVA